MATGGANHPTEDLAQTVLTGGICGPWRMMVICA